MVFYYSREYHSASIGVKVVEVTCEKCSALYYYELARVGKGQASAPYAVGSAGAAEKSTNQAQKNLEARLAEEAELVPCPKCQWINEELVVGYRRGQCRGWAKAALGIGFFGPLISLIMAWFVAIGPGADRGALPILLYVGPGVTIGIAVILLLIRSWLRSRIRPNDHFPHAPKLPPGCPRPLVKNPTTGELEPAPPWPGQEDAGDGWLDFQIGRVVLPKACSDCLGVPDPKSVYQRPLDQAVTLTIPRCASCALKAKRTAYKMSLIGLVGTIPILLAMKLEPFEFVAGGLLIAVTGIGGRVLADQKTRPIRVKFVDRSRGILRIWFRNDEYRKLVEELAARRS